MKYKDMKKILIADDSLFIRKHLKDILTNAGYEVVGEAEDGLQAVNLYKELKPDLVTLDITMPNLTGIEAMHEIIKLDKNAKVVMCTAMSQKTFVDQALSGGASEFIFKPYKPELVISTIKGILSVQ